MPALTITEWYNTSTGALATDLSGTDKLVTNWLLRGVGLTMSATFVWTSTGSPAGAFAVEGTNDPNAGRQAPAVARTVTGDELDLTTLNGYAASYQPGGADDAGRLPIGPFKCPGTFLRYTYTPTSGGTGATAVVHEGT